MNDEELQKVFQVLSHCDHGCQHCVKNIFYYFGTIFPEYAKQAIDYYHGDWEWWEPTDPNQVYEIPGRLPEAMK